MMTLYLNIEHQCQKCQQQDQVSLQQVFKETLFIVAVYKNYSPEAVLSNQSQVTAKMILPRWRIFLLRHPLNKDKPWCVPWLGWNLIRTVKTEYNWILTIIRTGQYLCPFTSWKCKPFDLFITLLLQALVWFSRNILCFLPFILVPWCHAVIKQINQDYLY